MSQPIVPSESRQQCRAGIDLKWALVIKIILVAFFCVTGGAIFSLRNVASEAASQNGAVADYIAHYLSLQILRIETSLDLPERYPDWEAVSSYPLKPGQCIRLPKLDGTPGNSTCSGIGPHALTAPDWFAGAYAKLFLGHSDAERRLTLRGREKGIVKATTAPEVVAEHAWLDLSKMLGVWASIIGVLCVLVYAVVYRALKPTSEILTGINRLGEGDLTCRLPPYKLNELDRISQVFNELAQKLQTATQQRADLARQLVDARERERARIARELHDDVAQRLAALNVAARSIRKHVGANSSDVDRECDAFVEMGSGALRSLRDTLVLLRPPEIDELGLVASLQELADSQNRAMGGATKIMFERHGDFDWLAAETAAHIYRIVQEGLNNACRHANAGHVNILLRSLPAEDPKGQGRIELTISDDGAGPPTGWMAARKGARVGLAGIKERVFALNGNFYAGAGLKGGFELRIGFLASRDSERWTEEAA